MPAEFCIGLLDIRQAGIMACQLCVLGEVLRLDKTIMTGYWLGEYGCVGNNATACVGIPAL